MDDTPLDDAGRARSIPPAEGERRAIGGYAPQYRVAAHLIYRALRERTLEWVRVADPEAGRVDDIVIGSPGRVDAFQVKWAQYGGTFTFRDLTSPQDGAPPLIAQLADGWQRSLRAYPGRRVVVHLVTNQIASVADDLPMGDPPAVPRHFAAFVGQAWMPSSTSPTGAQFVVPPAWRAAWEALATASRLPDTEFASFARDCDLRFSFGAVGEVSEDRDQQMEQADIGLLAEVLKDLAADRARIIELSLGDLLARLKWEKRLGLRSKHEFRDPDIAYRPVESSLRHLERALAELSGGYIGVFGTPGSGKSTLLTQTLRRRPERVIRYYAFVPDAQDPQVLRGESSSFLHDVVVMLNRQGFGVGLSLPGFDRALLLQTFHVQLQRLHHDWRERGTKTIILIDGLDHIAREQRPGKSLVDDLPEPNQVPDGVYIVLGSQTDTGLPSAVQFAVQHPPRRIEMNPLSREAVLAIIAATPLPVSPSPAQAERISELSGGHPLALEYILNRIRSVAEPGEIDSLLRDTERFEGHIEAQYHSYWRQIEPNHGLAHLFGLIARVRGAVDLRWVETWANPAAAADLRRTAAHYFSHESPAHWRFFHNSFRLFLLERTAEGSPGQPDPDRGRSYHRELAGYCAEAAGSSVHRWDELYHWVGAGEHDRVLGLASQAFFRRQIFALRAPSAVIADIAIAARSACARQDALALTRLLLAGAEANQRASSLDVSSVVRVLLDLNEGATASEYLRDGARLRVDADEALALSLDFRSAGMVDEARRVFDLAEPSGILAGEVPLDQVHDVDLELLDVWAQAAPGLRALEHLFVVVVGLHLPSDYEPVRGRTASADDLRVRLLSAFGYSLIADRRWDDLALVLAKLEEREEGGEAWFWLHVRAWRDADEEGDRARATQLLTTVLSRAASTPLSADQRVALAEGVYLLLRDEPQARGWLEGVSQPQLDLTEVASSDEVSAFLPLFRLTRLLRALGDRRSPAEIIPDADDASDEGRVILQRTVCRIAQFWGDAWRGDAAALAGVGGEVPVLLRLLNRRTRSVHWHGWYLAQRIRGELYSLLVKGVALHSPASLASVRDAFVRDWTAEESAGFWPADARRHVIRALVEAGMDPAWAVQQLRGLEGPMLADLEPREQAEQCREQAQAFAWLDRADLAREWLDRVLLVSAGIGGKDYQLDPWIQWLGRVNAVDHGPAAQRVGWFAQAVVALDASAGGAVATSAAGELLTVALQWSPRRALVLFRWLYAERVIPYQDAIASLVQAALGSERAPAPPLLLAAIECLLPIATKASPGLLSGVVQRAADADTPAQVVEVARELVRMIDTFALPSTRHEWQRGVASALRRLHLDLSAAGIDPVVLQPERADYSNEWLSLSDEGARLSVEDIKGRVATVADMISLLDRQARPSYFNWAPVVQDLAPRLDADGVRQLADAFEGRDREWQILTLLSMRLSELGDRKGAWHLGERALARSSTYGWSQWYDGGSRLAAFEALAQADRTAARQRVFEIVRGDLSEHLWSGYDVGTNLHRILPILCTDVPTPEVWQEIEEYVHALFEGTALPDGPPQLDEPPASDTPSRALMDLLTFALAVPIDAVAQPALSACARLLAGREAPALDAVEGYLGRGEEYQRLLLATLDAAGLLAPAALRQFRERVTDLQLSPSFEVRNAAGSVAARAGWETVRGAVTRAAQLPPIYGLEIARRRAAIPHRPRLFRPGEPPPELEDPLDITLPFEGLIARIAEHAGIDEVNIAYRAVEIMRELAPEEEWSRLGEQRLRGLLDAAGLKFRFHRPMVDVLRRAMMRIIAELADADKLDRASLRSLRHATRFYDPSMALQGPSRRPMGIPPIPGLSEYGSAGASWVDEAAESVHAVLRTLPDGRVVLAEETWLAELERRKPTEVRRAMIQRLAAPPLLIPPEPTVGFGEIFSGFLMEYPRMALEEEPTPLVLRHEPVYNYVSWGESWLALNPAIGDSLGWSIAGDGLFRWIGADGEVAVESVWWRDGTLDHHSLQFQNQVGEGWLVLASPSAWAAVRARLGPVERRVAIRRSLQRDGSDGDQVGRAWRSVPVGDD